jgi:hypothetical protein
MSESDGLRVSVFGIGLRCLKGNPSRLATNTKREGEQRQLLARSRIIASATSAGVGLPRDLCAWLDASMMSAARGNRLSFDHSSFLPMVERMARRMRCRRRRSCIVCSSATPPLLPMSLRFCVNALPIRSMNDARTMGLL